MAAARFQSISLLLHACAIGLLLLLSSHTFLAPPPPKAPWRHAIPLTAPPLRRMLQMASNRSGGSNLSPSPATRGTPPARAVRTFIPPPAQHPPTLEMTPTIDFDVPAINVPAPHFGDPFAKLGPASFGNRGGDGIGNGPRGRGIGDELGGRPGLSGRFAAPTKAAQLTYRVEPEFSEDARKAKFQGMVVLMIEIGVDGQPHNMKVVSPAGLGLDQKAIEAVSKWRFKPAERDGKPLASTARVEVFFHLL